MMGHREHPKSGDEYDLVCKAPVRYLEKPGVKHAIKRRLTRRERRTTVILLKQEAPR